MSPGEVRAEDVPVREAATVMVVRDGADGIEVFMLRRSLTSVFVGGAYVFPGGAVDEADRHSDLEAVCAGRSDAEASEALGLDGGGLAYWVAAIRECFEEAGLLLAYRDDGSIVTLSDPEVIARFAGYRSTVHSGEQRLVDVCADEGLTLAVDRLFYFSHWITPLGSPRRFDTRFFIAAAPEEQVGLHDDRETIANTWIRPADALRQHAEGEFQMITPTIRNLEAIGRFATVDELLAAAAAVQDVPAIMPRVVHEGGEDYGSRIVLPGDPEYDRASERLPEGAPLPGLPGGPDIGR